MRRYRYIGVDPFLSGMTALGQEADNVFTVQADDLEHPWAFDWHETSKTDWQEIDEQET